VLKILLKEPVLQLGLGKLCTSKIIQKIYFVKSMLSAFNHASQRVPNVHPEGQISPKMAPPSNNVSKKSDKENTPPRDEKTMREEKGVPEEKKRGRPTKQKKAPQHQQKKAPAQNKKEPASHMSPKPQRVLRSRSAKPRSK
jgi:hypothetical protein